jgi:hypothetical protein
MKYEDFEKFVREKCMYETIYDDSDGRQVLIMQMLDAYGMVNKAQREWQGLTDEERNDCLVEADPCEALADPEAQQLMEQVEAKLKEKNT